MDILRATIHARQENLYNGVELCFADAVMY
jgi:hypothetical protein